MPSGRTGASKIMIADGGDSLEETRPGPQGITEEDFQRLQPKLVGHFRRQGSTLEGARELAQETLLQAHRNLSQFRGQAEFDTWVLSIAKILWLRQRRDRKRLKRTAEEVPLDELRDSAGLGMTDAASPERHAVASDMLARVRGAMRRLPDEMRRALMLHIKGHKYREIAENMDMTQNRVSSLIHQARAKLRQAARRQPADSAP